ncbi:pyrroline-5-carboxylate reductase [Fluviicoccus keumensis]|uniref:Pyrroline-5-carboxylate reductase n=1 Tax=Fluviicoccus keumensis TaxID=1435465 RepID=A0A4Q7ZAW9_9GAMM|nr:pyrroline-5-carboxylate reductase [Fluviicoccus keumensis]RZU47718.1 pyrroline-5-carboxylate reductase [Fluviicoccus keumensis]
MTITIGFIGAGNMAGALAGGLLARGHAPERLALSDTSEQQLQAFRSQGVWTTQDNQALAARADVLVLAVKPQVLKDVLKPLAGIVQARRPLIVSIAAGIPAASIERWLGGNLAIVRAMPNTPALVQAGATGLYANPRVDETLRARAAEILGAVGITVWVEDEALIDSVTAVSGSGPAYFFYVMEAMVAAGRSLGLDEATARSLTLQTALGAAQMAITADAGPEELRRRVTSPGGTTERAIAALDAGKVREAFANALQACAARGAELADVLGGQD